MPSQGQKSCQRRRANGIRWDGARIAASARRRNRPATQPRQGSGWRIANGEPEGTPHSIWQRSFRSAIGSTANAADGGIALPHLTPEGTFLCGESAGRCYDICTVQEHLGHSDVEATMMYSHVLKRDPSGIRSAMD